MTRFSKYRELITLARRLEAEAASMNANHQGRWDRLAEAEQYRARAAWMAGRIDREEMDSRISEAMDAGAYPV